MKSDLPAYPFIRQEAKFGGTGLSEHELRLMLCRGELPGFYVGETKKYFRIDHEKLLEVLKEKSRPSAT